MHKHIGMLRNFLTVAWRNLVKSIWYSLINTLGLSIGMAVALLIGLVDLCRGECGSHDDHVDDGKLSGRSGRVDESGEESQGRVAWLRV